MDDLRRKSLRVVGYDSSWPARFAIIGAELRHRLGDTVLRIDHIGSTAVFGLAAKDVIDVQATVARLEVAEEWPDELLPNLKRRPGVTEDHVPAGLTADGSQWAKPYWSEPSSIHLHVREHGRLNQRYPLLFRDYLRTDPIAAGACGRLKRALADAAVDDWDTYYAVKDPACDLVIAAAEQWAASTEWAPGPTDV